VPNVERCREKENCIMSWRSKSAGLALTVSLLLPVWFMVSALGVKFGLWSWQFGLGVLIVQWGLPLLIAATVVAVVALIALLVRKPRRSWPVALIALIIPALGLGYLGWIKAQSDAIPPIHDISTDIVDPPVPSARLLALRSAEEANPVVDMTAPLTAAQAYQGEGFARFGDRSLGQVGQEAYPMLRTKELAVSPVAAFAAARDAARGIGWTLVTEDEAGGTLEATAETFWFGFQDDVIIRVRPAAGGQGSRIDVRSISRVGLSDLGANAKRIEDYLAQVSAEPEA
jgi:fatty-acyl-CoA synthase